MLVQLTPAHLAGARELAAAAAAAAGSLKSSLDLLVSHAFLETI